MKRAGFPQKSNTHREKSKVRAAPAARKASGRHAPSPNRCPQVASWARRPMAGLPVRLEHELGPNGARLAFGCNIGAYFSGIVSGSLHGWLWAVAAFLGSVVGTRLRPRERPHQRLMLGEDVQARMLWAPSPCSLRARRPCGIPLLQLAADHIPGPR